MKHDQIWYEFNSLNEVIVPSGAVEKLASAVSREISIVDEDDMVRFDDSSDSCEAIPVVALLGHFNHGKTTLLDAIRGGLKITDDEAHQITQVVRSRGVVLNSSSDSKTDMIHPEKEITIIDTPGQDIFYRMRNYGAAVADIGVLVVACDDGVCPQTEESIGILEQLNIPVVVALNKIDHSNATPSRVQEIVRDLREFVILEDVPIVPISALRGDNIGELISNLLLCTASLKQTEKLVGEYKHYWSSSKYKGSGILANSWSNQKDGQVFHVIVRKGSVQPGDWFSGGGWVGSVVSVTRDEMNLSVATSGMGVRLRVKIKERREPSPLGDSIFFFAEDNSARKLADFRQMENLFPSYALTDSKSAHHLEAQWLHNFAGRAAAEKFKMEGLEGNSDNECHSQDYENFEQFEDAAVVKADTSLSLSTFHDNLAELREKLYEPIVSDIDRSSPPDLRLRRIVRKGIGDITPMDVLVAHSAKAPILAYEVGILPEAAKQAEIQGVKVFYFDKMEDVVNILGGADLNEFKVLKPKRRHKNSV